jgi:cytochrome c biogenesis protein CcmG/thiol:disulfide interchange protein DsbE
MEGEAPRDSRGWLLAGVLGLVVMGGIGWFAYPSGREVNAKASTSEHASGVARLDFTLNDMDGKPVRLADYKGRPLVLNFWATYCGPCKTEIPIFVDLVEKYRAQKLAILGISIDDSPAELRPFAAQYKMNYPVLVGLGHDELIETYDAVMFIPITWFIRPDGTVHAKHPGSATREWFDEQIRSLVAARSEAP